MSCLAEVYSKHHLSFSHDIGNEVDPSIRRMKAVLTHPIGDYAVQPKDVSGIAF